jgi:hypothetical protein
VRVSSRDSRARALADRHYSRQQPGTRDFMPPGQKLVLLTPCERAVWAVVANLDPAGSEQFRVSLFRCEGGGLASDLIRSATATTYELWRERYGALPSVPLRTEVDPRKVRRKRDPGRCFLRAGWRYVGKSRSHRHRGALVFEAPPP